jgi:hypothetical protein
MPGIAEWYFTWVETRYETLATILLWTLLPLGVLGGVFRGARNDIDWEWAVIEGLGGLVIGLVLAVAWPLLPVVGLIAPVVVGVFHLGRWSKAPKKKPLPAQQKDPYLTRAEQEVEKVLTP